MMRILILLFIALNAIPASAQFAPQAGVAGSTAISKSSNSFVAWASNCRLQKGWLHIEDKSLGHTTLGDSAAAIGKADNIIVSLGDSGVATLTFEATIFNGEGADFAVFENGFPNPSDPQEAFLELAFVEVSSDGINFTRFPASSLTDTPQVPIAGVYMDARKLNNLAGKYITNYGTPFDLQELAATPGLDVNNITHIRIVDVIGALNSFGTKDKDGNLINDPYPSPIPGSGFDLDAVGVMHMKGKFPSNITSAAKPDYILYPNPVSDRLIIRTEAEVNVQITDITGKLLLQESVNGLKEIPLGQYRAGIYVINFDDTKGNKWVEKITKL
jgi:hypothetical protein